MANVQGLINDPAFLAKTPDEQRMALAGVTEDNNFLSLSDADLFKFTGSFKVPEMWPSHGPQAPTPVQPMLSQQLDALRNRIGQQQPVPPPGSGISRPATELGNMGAQLLQSIYDILPLNVANELYKKHAGLPNRLAELAPEAVMTVGPMALGAEERPNPYGYTRDVRAPQQAATTPEAAASAPSGSISTAGKVARHLPYVGKYIRAYDALSDLLDTIKGKTEAPPTPTPPAAPPVSKTAPTGPPEAWGQYVSQPTMEAPEVPEPKTPGESPRPKLEREMPSTLSGEGVLGEALSGVDNRTLLRLARSRNINVADLAQLKPGVGNSRIIRRIIDDFSGEELTEARDRWLEETRMNVNAPWANNSPELWRVRVLGSLFPDVKVPAISQMRAQKEVDALRVQGMR